MRSTRRRQVRGAILLAIASIGVVSALHQPDADAAGNGRDGKFVPENGAYFGLWMRRGEHTQANIQKNITTRETQLGRKLDIDHHYYQWNSTFPGWREPWDIANGRIPMISWAAVNTLDVNNGSYDAHIRARAQGLRALGKPVFLEWFWEPEQKDKTYLTNGYTNYHVAWRRIHNIFQQEGAANVAFVWCPTSWGFYTGEAQKFYPGDAYVDWVCSDGYNWAPGKPGSKWEDWEKIFRPTHDFAVAHNKPMMAGEIGLMEGTTGQKAAWFDQARSQIKSSFPNLAAFVYYDEDRTMYAGEYNWEVDSSTSSLNAWIGIGRDPYFNKNYVPPTSTTVSPTTGSPTTATPTTVTPTTAPPTTVTPTTQPPTTTTPPPPPPGSTFSANFDTGSLGDWTQSAKATISGSSPQAGAGCVVLSTTSGGAFLAKQLPSPKGGVTVDVWLKVQVRPNLGTSVILLRDANGNAIASVNLRKNGELLLRDATSGAIAYSGVIIPNGSWQHLVLFYNATAGSATVALNGGAVPGLTVSGAGWSAPNIGRFELGDMGGKNDGKSFTMAFDSLNVI